MAARIVAAEEALEVGDTGLASLILVDLEADVVAALYPGGGGVVSVERTCMECGRPSLTDLCIDCERGLVPDYDVYDDPDAGAEYREPVAKRPRPSTSSRPRPQVTSSLVPSP